MEAGISGFGIVGAPPMSWLGQHGQLKLADQSDSTAADNNAESCIGNATVEDAFS